MADSYVLLYRGERGHNPEVCGIAWLTWGSSTRSSGHPHPAMDTMPSAAHAVGSLMVAQVLSQAVRSVL